MKKSSKNSLVDSSLRPGAPPAAKWRPNDPGVVVEHDPSTTCVRRISHVNYPFEAVWDGRNDWDGLFRIGHAYLTVVNTRLELPRAWIDDLAGKGTRKQSSIPLAWFPAKAGQAGSFWAERRAVRSAGRVWVDRTAVLIAGLIFPETIPMLGGRPLYGEQGLRIVAHVVPMKGHLSRVLISGVVSTLPKWSGHARDAKVVQILDRGFSIDALFKALTEAFGLPPGETIVEAGLKLPDNLRSTPQSVTVFAKTSPGLQGRRAAHGKSYSLKARLTRAGLDPIVRQPLVTFADAKVFKLDPVSKNGGAAFVPLRPNRSSMVLDSKRELVQFGALTPGANPNTVQLADLDGQWDILNTRLVDRGLSESASKEVPDRSDAHVRTNEFAAVNSHHHAGELFGRMASYGLDPATYFKFVEVPVKVRYRSGIYPGFSDGRTINAQVVWTLKPVPDMKGSVEVRFALGDMQSSIARSPLGVASDPRWSWHEYGHVLLTAAVGEMEFRFAHSAGDALGAILCDPTSKLAFDRNGVLADKGPWRGVTFPWIFIPRRHDRDVQRGWSWTGCLHRHEYSPAGVKDPDRRGYWAEQILSTSLFRLYRAIGGDTQAPNAVPAAPNVAARKDAADYAAYLIMRGIELLGPARVTPALTPGVYVDTLRMADRATTNVAGPGGYVGGTVHKVILWAFQRQGLYGTPVTGLAVAGPDDPASVDLHIDDLRNASDGPYTPVTFADNTWHASPSALWIRRNIGGTADQAPRPGRNNHVYAVVKNRGPVRAMKVQVEVWWAPAAAGVPDFPGAAWQSLGSLFGNVPRTAGNNPGKKQFGPFTWATPQGAGQAYALLVTATSTDDRANTDPSTNLPCVTMPSPIRHLVAFDNNLGLRVVST